MTFLYGRGVCDAKGIVAAQIAAGERLRDEGLPVACCSWWARSATRPAPRWRTSNPRGSQLSDQRRTHGQSAGAGVEGRLRVELRAHGKMAHSAYPELGESAIDKLLAALHDVQALELPVVEGIGDSTLNVGLISGGRAPNVIADAAEAHLLIRLVGPAEAIREADPGGRRRALRGGFLSGAAVCADAGAGRLRDDGGQVHHGHPQPDELG